MTCDFCSDPHVAWLYPARNFTIANMGWGSNSSWAACEGCADLIEKHRDDELVSTRMVGRALSYAMADVGMKTLTRQELRQVERQTRRLLETFRKSRTGPRQLADTEAAS